MKNFVVGFYMRGDKVLFIEKERPKWQKGKLNGVGGHIEPGEKPLDAMVREFEEETGTYVRPGRWTLFCKLYARDGIVWIYRADWVMDDRNPLPQTDETVLWWPKSDLSGTLSNIRWLIPMADHSQSHDWPFVVEERAKIDE